MAVDRPRQRLTYAIAGHPPALLLRRNGQIERLAEAGIVLTFLPDATYETADVPFEPGDRLLIFTDGLLEATRVDGDEFFGDVQLGRVVSALPAAGDMLLVVEQAHRDWIGAGTPLSDDVTLVAVECVRRELAVTGLTRPTCRGVLECGRRCAGYRRAVTTLPGFPAGFRTRLSGTSVALKGNANA